MMRINPIQPSQPTIPFKSNFVKEDGELNNPRHLNSQVIAHIRPSFKGHWPNYSQPPVVYCNHPIPPEGVGEKLDFIA